MAGLERRYEAKHLEQMQTGYNSLARLLRVNANTLAKEIHILQSKRKLEPKKYGSMLSRNNKLSKLIKANFDALEVDLFSGLEEQTSNQWALANTKNDLLTKAFIGEIPVKYAKLNLDALQEFQKRNTNGLNLSSRIHNLTEQNQQLYKDYIGSGITQGRSAARIAKDLNAINKNPYNVTIFDKGGNPVKMAKISPTLKPNAKGRGIYRSPLKNLERVTRTETNAAYRLSDHERYQQLDFVVGIRINLSGAHNVNDICNYMAGDYPKDFKFSGFHAHCLCYVTSIIMTKDEFRSKVKISKNQVHKIPVSAQRYMKTHKQQYWDWQKEFFSKEGIPSEAIGGASKGIKAYKINTDAKNYKQKNKILKKASKSVVR